MVIKTPWSNSCELALTANYICDASSACSLNNDPYIASTTLEQCVTQCQQSSLDNDPNLTVWCEYLDHRLVEYVQLYDAFLLCFTLLRLCSYLSSPVYSHSDGSGTTNHQTGHDRGGNSLCHCVCFVHSECFIWLLVLLWICCMCHGPPGNGSSRVIFWTVISSQIPMLFSLALPLVSLLAHPFLSLYKIICLLIFRFNHWEFASLRWSRRRLVWTDGLSRCLAFWESFLFSFCAMAILTALAIFFGNLDVIMGIIGAVGCSSFMLIIPGLMYANRLLCEKIGILRFSQSRSADTSHWNMLCLCSWC